MSTTNSSSSRLSEIISRNEKNLLEDWLSDQSAALTARKDLISETDLRRQATEFLALFINACKSENLIDISTAAWSPVLDFLKDVSNSRANLGFTPTETATFIFSLKQPVFTLLKQDLANETAAFSEDIWATTVILDKLGLYTAEHYLKRREAVIKRQQAEMLELSTPVVKVWDGILALPLIGTLDSARTQIVMENLLNTIVDTGSSVAILDITGVPTVDTLVAQHLIRTVSAAKLMGAQCIISGIRPQIAQTMVHLGVAFEDVATKTSMSDALVLAFRIIGYAVSKSELSN